MKTKYILLPILATVAVVGLSGCVTNTEGGGSSDSTPAPNVSVDSEAVALLPADVKSSGTLIIGTDAAYPPNEYRDANGDVVGWSIELTEAVSARLGLKPQWEIAGFDSIIPNVQGGKMNMGSSSFTDNAERQKVVDFVNYYQAGVTWAQPIGKTVDPNNACGLKVAVQAGTFQHTDELPAKNKACTDAGKPAIEVLPFDGQAEATNAVALGQADAFSADSPVTLSAIHAQSDKIEVAGKSFDVAPYGYVLPKGSQLTPAVQAAMQSLIDDGTYLEILKKAGVEDGAITKATINAGS